MRAMEVREKEVEDKLRRVEVREKEVEEREKKIEENDKESRVASERSLVLEQKEVEYEEKSKELDELYDILEEKDKELNVRNKELVSREKMLRLNLEQVNERVKEIELKEREFEEKEKEKLRLKEEEFNVLWKRLETRENGVVEEFRMLGVKEKQINERSKALDLREEELNARCKTLELKQKSIDDRQHEMELNEKEANQVCGKLELKDKQANEYHKSLELKEKQGNVDCKSLELKDKQGNESCKALELKEKQVNGACKSLELKEKQANESRKALDLKEKQANESCKALELKEKQVNKHFQSMETNDKQMNMHINVVNKELELKEKDINGHYEMLESKETRVMERFEDVEMKDKEDDKGREAVELKDTRFDECCIPMELKEKELNEQPQTLKPQEKHIGKTDHKVQGFKEGQMNEKRIHEPSMLSRCQSQVRKEEHILDSSSTQMSQEKLNSGLSEAACGEIHLFCRNMDSDGVMSYLMDHVKELNLIREVLVDALRSAPDPAKLVLSVSLNFHRKSLCTNQNNATKDSCIYLLEQMVKLSPAISLEVKDDATNFAAFLKSKLKWADALRDTYGFLQFVAAFKLANLYGANELLSLFDIFYCQNEVYRPDDIPNLCHALGLSKKIPGIIKSLVETRNRLLALKYICVFKLGNNFPPVTLLEAHLQLIRGSVNDRLKDGTIGSKIQASHLELMNLEEVVKCVRSLKLEQKFPVDSLVSRILKLEKVEENRKLFALLQTKKRNSSSCASVGYPDHQEKRPRVEHDHHSDQVAPLDRKTFPQPLLPHATHQTPNLQPARQFHGSAEWPSCNLVNPHGQVVAPGMHPLGVPVPVYYGGTEAQVGIGKPLPQSSLVDDFQKLCGKMDTKGVRSYLIQHVKEFDMLGDKVLESLQSASDPAKLVLDVIQSFYEVEMEKVPVDKFMAICIFLLVQLVKLKAHISPYVEGEARRFIDVWRFLLEQHNTALENFGHLLFLASFNLVNNYDAEILSLFETFFDDIKDYQPEEIHSLCHSMALLKEIPGVIQLLILSDKRLLAIRYICALKMEVAFPLAPILRAHVENIEKKVKDIIEQGGETSQDDATNAKITAFKEVCKFIYDFKLESSYSPASLENRIKQLEDEQEERNNCAHLPAMSGFSNSEKRIVGSELSSGEAIRNLPENKSPKEGSKHLESETKEIEINVDPSLVKRWSSLEKKGIEEMELPSGAQSERKRPEKLSPKEEREPLEKEVNERKSNALQSAIKRGSLLDNKGLKDTTETSNLPVLPTDGQFQKNFVLSSYEKRAMMVGSCRGPTPQNSNFSFRPPVVSLPYNGCMYRGWPHQTLPTVHRPGYYFGSPPAYGAPAYNHDTPPTPSLCDAVYNARNIGPMTAPNNASITYRASLERKGMEEMELPSDARSDRKCPEDSSPKEEREPLEKEMKERKSNALQSAIKKGLVLDNKGLKDTTETSNLPVLPTDGQCEKKQPSNFVVSSDEKHAMTVGYCRGPTPHNSSLSFRPPAVSLPYNRCMYRGRPHQTSPAMHRPGYCFGSPPAYGAPPYNHVRYRFGGPQPLATLPTSSVCNSVNNAGNLAPVTNRALISYREDSAEECED